METPVDIPAARDQAGSPECRSRSGVPSRLGRWRQLIVQMGAASTGSAQRPAGLRHVFREASAGVVAASLTLPLCVGAGVLAYAPLGPDWISRGAVAGLVCAIAGGTASALARRSSFVATFPTTPICVIQASVLASIVATVGASSRALGLMSLCVVCVGLWQILFALSGLSRMIRFVPHPVMAGFVTGVAALIAWHQVPSLLGVRHLGGGSSSGLLPHPLVSAFGAVLLGSILLLGRIAPKAPSLLVGLVSGTAAHHLLGTLLPGADIGATIGAIPAVPVERLLPGWTELAAVLGDAGLVRTLLVGSLTLALVGTLDTFFALRTARLLADADTDPRRDVFGQGVGNLVSALAGGLVVSTSLSVSTANHRAGGRTRLSTVTSGVALLVGGVLVPSVVTWMPLVVIGAILVATSLRLVDRWSFQVLRLAFTAPDPAQRRRAARDGSVVLAVFLATILGRPMIGVAVGVGLSCLLFMLDMSRPVVARRRNGGLVRSRRLRTVPELEELADRGRSIVILELQGVLFFGNADGLSTDIQALGDEAGLVVLDCRRIREIDTSGITVLSHVAARLAERGGHLLVSGARPGWFDGAAAAGRRGVRLFPALDDALEWAEDRILDTGTERRFGSVRGGALATAASDFLEAAERGGRLPIARFRPGSLLCQGGNPRDRMWILRSGTVAVFQASGPRTFLARLGPGCPVGEMVLLDQGPRSADVVAEEEVEAFVVTEEEYAGILVDDPVLALKILVLVANHLASRLRDTAEDFRFAENCA